MRFLLALLLSVMVACGGSMPAMQYQVTMPQVVKVEEKPLPERPDAQKIPAEKDWVVPLDKGEKAPDPGVLLSEDKAARVKLFQIDYNELRGEYEADRKVWEQTRIIYEERLNSANNEIRHLQPNWWDSNKGTIGFIGGFVLGGLATVGVVYGVEKATGN